MSCADPISPIDKKTRGKLPRLIGRNPSLTAEQREICRLERMKRVNGEAYVSTPQLALRFGVCEATIKNAARGLWIKHEEFVKRLVQLSAGLRNKAANNSR